MPGTPINFSPTTSASKVSQRGLWICRPIQFDARVEEDAYSNDDADEQKSKLRGSAAGNFGHAAEIMNLIFHRFGRHIFQAVKICERQFDIVFLRPVDDQRNRPISNV